MSTRLGRNDLCLCGSGKKYKRCCYPRALPNLSKPNAGVPLPAGGRSTPRWYSPPPVAPQPQPTVPRDRGFPYTQVLCLPLPPFGDGAALAGTLAPPTPEQYRGMYEAIRGGDPRNPVEVVVEYTYPEPFGHAEVSRVFPADWVFRLADGRRVPVTHAARGMQILMDDGDIGTVTANARCLYEIPPAPHPWTNGTWLSRVVGTIKHHGYEVIDFRWAGNVVTVTPDHPFWSESRRAWVPAGEMARGEMLLVAGGRALPVEAIGPRRLARIELYNVEVEYFHNYFVGEDDDAMLVHNGPGYIKTPADAAARPLTQAEAEAVFAAMAAKGDQIAFKYVKAGCESRAQVMMEHMEALGIDPGRATILTGGKQLAIPDPLNKGKFLPWNNHTAPFVAVEGQPHGVLIIDPSLSKTGPMTVQEWAGAMRARELHVSDTPLSVAQMTELQTAAGIRAQPIDSFVFLVERGKAPVPELGGSGFRLAADPPNGVSAFAHEQMQHYLKLQAQLRPGRPWPE